MNAKDSPRYFNIHKQLTLLPSEKRAMFYILTIITNCEHHNDNKLFFIWLSGCNMADNTPAVLQQGYRASYCKS